MHSVLPICDQAKMIDREASRLHTAGKNMTMRAHDRPCRRTHHPTTLPTSWRSSYFCLILKYKGILRHMRGNATACHPEVRLARRTWTQMTLRKSKIGTQGSQWHKPGANTATTHTHTHVCESEGPVAFLGGEVLRVGLCLDSTRLRPSDDGKAFTS